NARQQALAILKGAVAAICLSRRPREEFIPCAEKRFLALHFHGQYFVVSGYVLAVTTGVHQFRHILPGSQRHGVGYGAGAVELFGPLAQALLLSGLGGSG